jgi:hypothetical protein
MIIAGHSSGTIMARNLVWAPGASGILIRAIVGVSGRTVPSFLGVVRVFKCEVPKEMWWMKRGLGVYVGKLAGTGV